MPVLSSTILKYALPPLVVGGGLAYLTIRADRKRRGRLPARPDFSSRFAQACDLATPGFFVFVAVIWFSRFLFFRGDAEYTRSTESSLAASLGSLLIASLTWIRGEKSRFQARPAGEVVALGVSLNGLLLALLALLNHHNAFVGFTQILLGITLSLVLKAEFRKQRGEHRILQHVVAQGDVLQPEYHRPTPECPEPERWRMYDSMTAEYEVLAFLQQLVETVKPKIIVETGTFMGISTLKLAEGLKANGAGKVITCEYDPIVYAKAVERINASGLKEWIDARNESSLEMQIDGEVDLLFSDSDPELREAEVRRYLPLLRANGLILIHDASSHLKTVREAALKLEREGLISIVLLPTPRGLVLAQKREGRTD